MHPVGADFKIVLHSVLLPRHPPIGRNAANIEAGTLSGWRLKSAADVTGTVEGSREVQMLVPHGVGAQSGDILRQRRSPPKEPSAICLFQNSGTGK